GLRYGHRRTERSETMTRETKVGIVVSCSFVGLVGVVIASKLRDDLPPPPAEPSTSPVVMPDGKGEAHVGQSKSRGKNSATAKPTPTMDGARLQEIGSPAAAPSTASEGPPSAPPPSPRLVTPPSPRPAP